MDGMLILCQQMQACPTCAMIASLYVAAQAGRVGSNVSEEAFLRFCKEVWDDLNKQLGGKLVL